MGGDELARRLRALRPDLPLILVSGYDAARAERLHARCFDAFLRKPWEPEELVAVVARAREEGRPGE